MTAYPLNHAEAGPIHLAPPGKPSQENQAMPSQGSTEEKRRAGGQPISVRVDTSVFTAPIVEPHSSEADLKIDGLRLSRIRI